MGTDIHVNIHLKQQWTSDSCSYDFCVARRVLCDFRDYGFFGILAGVRHDPYDGEAPVSQCRPMPDWLSEYDLPGDHSRSWCTPDEWTEACTRLFKHRGAPVCAAYDLPAAIARAAQAAFPNKEVIIVFGFDS